MPSALRKWTPGCAADSPAGELRCNCVMEGGGQTPPNGNTEARIVWYIFRQEIFLEASMNQKLLAAVFVTALAAAPYAAHAQFGGFTPQAQSVGSMAEALSAAAQTIRDARPVVNESGAFPVVRMAAAEADNRLAFALGSGGVSLWRLDLGRETRRLDAGMVTAWRSRPTATPWPPPPPTAASRCGMPSAARPAPPWRPGRESGGCPSLPTAPGFLPKASPAAVCWRSRAARRKPAWAARPSCIPPIPAWPSPRTGP